MHEERLRPLTVSTVEHILTAQLGARPAPGLAASLRTACRGIPAVVHAAIEGYLAVGGLRIVDRGTHLVGNSAPRLPASHPLFTALRGTSTWPVVKALAVLHPLGEAAPRLIAETAGIGADEVLDVLHTLCADGVVLRGNGWRFRVPMLAALLTGCLGPYERRRSAQLAVTAIWDGTASRPDGEYLPERIVVASRLVDGERAAAELLAHAETAPVDLAIRWRWAACGRLTDPARSAAALHRHAVGCAQQQRLAPAAMAAQTALREHPDSLTPDAVPELRLICVAGLGGNGNTAALRELTETSLQSLPGSWADRIVNRAAAFCLLDQWEQARDLLLAERELWSGGEAGVAALGQALSDAVDAVTGTTPAASGPAGAAVEEAQTLLRALGLDPASARVGEDGESAVSQSVRAMLAGQWNYALNLARSAIANAPAQGESPGQTAMFREMAAILTARGQLSRARDVLADVRSRHLLLPHQLALPEADLELTIGAVQQSRTVVEDALAVATESGAVFGTDELWLRMAELETQSGNQAAARQCAERIERIADRLGTVDSHRNRLLARVLVDHDADAAAEVLQLASERGRPFEYAATVTAVAECGFADQKLVRTAYETFGELGALIPRARLRLLMRARNIAVTGRNATVAENERLLATLITEGLTNSQVATVLGTSEKSVEGRLTRFFQRTG
ncbi:hypothetical protein AB0L13_40160 [Saccharopolyspora shandongensis]|uniref:hypothetical protein n=1 Tax=Saccharopolyspora shandongensis TaxID=418495 RepID=UPI003423E6E1